MPLLMSKMCLDMGKLPLRKGIEPINKGKLPLDKGSEPINIGKLPLRISNLP
jgi:hypothetical protein